MTDPQTRNYKVKFIQKIEPKATATIKGKEVANNTNQTVYIVQIYNLKDIIKNTTLLTELFPFQLRPDSDLQNKIKDDDYFPVFPGHNLELRRITKKMLFSKDEYEKIVSPAMNNRCGANISSHRRFVSYTPAEIQIFTDLNG